MGAPKEPAAWYALVRDIGGPVTAIVAIAFIVRLDSTVATATTKLQELQETVRAMKEHQQTMAVQAATTATRLDSHLERVPGDDVHVQQAGRPR